MLLFRTKFLSSAILHEFDSRFNLLKRGIRVLEINHLKGEWTKLIVQRVRSSDSKGTPVIALDQTGAQPEIDGAHFIKEDFASEAALIQIQKALDLNPVDLLIANLKPDELPDDRDQACFMQISANTQALAIATKTLKTGGAMLMLARQGEGLRMFLKYANLHFKDFYQIRTNSIEMPELETYLLGVGFKLREEYHQYRSFFEKIQNGDSQSIAEEEIPPAYQTTAERDLETIQFLKTISQYQIEIGKGIVDEIKSHPRLSSLNLDELNLKFAPEPLSAEQKLMLFHAKFQFKLSFAPQVKSIEEKLTELEDRMHQFTKLTEEKDNSGQLLREGESLGVNTQEMDEQHAKLKQDFAKMKAQFEQGEFMTPEEQAQFQESLDEGSLEYWRQHHQGKESVLDVLQREIDVGNVTQDELRDVFEMNEQQLMEKLQKEQEHYSTMKVERKSQNLDKEHRNKYYEKKKKIKTRRQ